MKFALSSSLFTRKRLYIALPILGLSLIFLLGFIGSDKKAEVTQQATTQVSRGPLRISVVESGTIRPRQQLILRNDMERNTTIVSIVPEGTRVKKGDLIVELDDSEVLNDLVERRIRVQNSESTLVSATENLSVVKNQAEADIEKAKLDYKFAQQDLKKYLEGESPKQIKELETKITLAKEELNQAEEELHWSQILYDEKYLSESDLQRDKLTQQKVSLNLELAQEELALYKDFTFEREKAKLESDVTQTKLALDRTQRKAAANIAQAEAQLRANEAQNKEEQARLKRMETEAEKAKIYAPIDGMALYASSVAQRWRGDDTPIELGASVRPRAELIYLPTADDFDVDIKVTEVNLNKLSNEQPAIVKIDALPSQTFHGEISNISPVPDSSYRWMNPNLKLYNTVISLDHTDAVLRNGMSCEVEIIIDEFPDAIYVPLQSVVRENGKPVVYLVDGDAPHPQPVELGMDNNRMIQITGGLEAGQTVLLTPPLTGSSQKVNVPTPTSNEGGSETPPARVAKTKKDKPSQS